MTDLVLVECFLPESPVLRVRYDENSKGTPAAGLMISVSNNGIHQSQQKLKLISYDSVCMECNVSKGCLLKVRLISIASLRRSDVSISCGRKLETNVHLNYTNKSHYTWLFCKPSFLRIKKRNTTLP